MTFLDYGAILSVEGSVVAVFELKDTYITDLAWLEKGKVMDHFTLRIYFLILPNMKALIVKSKNPTEMKFLSDLRKKLGMSARVVDIDEVEDFGMSILMKEADRSKKVSRDTIMKKLN